MASCTRGVRMSSSLVFLEAKASLVCPLVMSYVGRTVLLVC